MEAQTSSSTYLIMVDLDQTFIHDTPTHKFTIKWMCLGDTKAPTICFIHGTPWSCVEWKTLAASLSSRYCIYLYDHPGFGQSPSPERISNPDQGDITMIDLDPSLTLRAEASAALFRSWNFSSAPHVIAHDNGGVVSLRMLLQHGLQFASLCLIDVVALSRTEDIPFFKLVAENEHVFTAIPPHLVEGFVHSYVKTAAYKPLAADDEAALCAPWLADGTQGPKRFLQEMVQAHHRAVGDVEKDYKEAGQRTHIKIIWGKDDAWIPVATATRLADAVGTKEEVILIEEAGHLIQYDQPSKLAVEVALWLDLVRNRT